MKKEKKLTKYEKDMLEYLRSKVLTEDEVKELNDKLDEYRDKRQKMSINMYYQGMSISIEDICETMLIAAKEINKGSDFVKGLQDVMDGSDKIHSEYNRISYKLNANKSILLILKQIKEDSEYSTVSLSDDIYTYLNDDKDILNFALQYPKFKEYYDQKKKICRYGISKDLVIFELK